MQEYLIQLLQTYPLAAPLVFMIIRSLSVIFPPIPGILLDAVGIVIFGWKLGFVYAEIGTVGGAMVAFWIARYFREPVVRRFVALQKLHDWEQSLSERKKFWALVSLRIITGPPLFDYINYAAGLTKIQPLKFFFATLIGSLPIMLGTYYLGGALLTKSLYLIIVFVLVILVVAMVQKKWYKKSYLEKSNQLD